VFTINSISKLTRSASVPRHDRRSENSDCPQICGPFESFRQPIVWNACITHLIPLPHGAPGSSFLIPRPCRACAWVQVLLAGPSPPRGALLGPRVSIPGILSYHTGFWRRPPRDDRPISRERSGVAAIVFYGDMLRRVVNLVRVLEPGSSIVDSIAGEKFKPARALKRPLAARPSITVALSDDF
jgi:hypothetical protein